MQVHVPLEPNVATQLLRELMNKTGGVFHWNDTAKAVLAGEADPAKKYALEQISMIDVQNAIKFGFVVASGRMSSVDGCYLYYLEHTTPNSTPWTLKVTVIMDSGRGKKHNGIIKINALEMIDDEE